MKAIRKTNVNPSKFPCNFGSDLGRLTCTPQREGQMEDQEGIVSRLNGYAKCGVKSFVILLSRLQNSYFVAYCQKTTFW
ncbi:hypothetical protein L1987_24265 [Smallanthus sonchifolius]|uniref:Uncharacterized protein n=1 Tax=Smallanthus sonchifolius TaxID=185202 RepID=A0ACB9ILE2_9ASTR|nr:hypothetical protein L1987_24265 [Smallanthus sonchifolius]